MGSLNELALFAGAGGGILGGRLLGWRTKCAVEIDPYCREVLLARQRDGHLPRFPIWDDIRTFNGRPWRGEIDVVSGGFPCQDISCAGNGKGITGSRSGLWGEMSRVIREVRPSFVFVENSPMLTSRGLGTVLGNLSQMGFNAEWGVIGARNVGAPHQRDRIWILAHTHGEQLRDQPRGASRTGGKNEIFSPINGQKQQVADANKTNVQGLRGALGIQKEDAGFGGQNWWETEPGLGRVANGVANWVDRLKAIGNGQVPGVAMLAWEILNEQMEKSSDDRRLGSSRCRTDNRVGSGSSVAPPGTDRKATGKKSSEKRSRFYTTSLETRS